MKSLKVFTAEWCGPCKQMAPHFDKLREQGIEVTTLDVQANRKLADDFGIRSIPTLFLYEGDFMLKKHIGAMTPDQLRDFIA